MLFNTFIIFSFFHFLKCGASEWSCRVALDSKSSIASSTLFSLLDLSWSRSVARHAIRKVCDCVLPHSSLPHSGSEVSGLLSQLWTCSFREPLSLLDIRFLKILKVDVFGVFGHFWGPQVNAYPGPILRVSGFWLFFIIYYNYFYYFYYVYELFYYF